MYLFLSHFLQSCWSGFLQDMSLIFHPGPSPWLLPNTLWLSMLPSLFLLPSSTWSHARTYHWHKREVLNENLGADWLIDWKPDLLVVALKTFKCTSFMERLGAGHFCHLPCQWHLDDSWVTTVSLLAEILWVCKHKSYWLPERGYQEVHSLGATIKAGAPDMCTSSFQGVIGDLLQLLARGRMLR